MKVSNAALATAVAMLLAACVAQPVRQVPPMAVTSAEATQAARAAILASHHVWSLQGRVALSNGHDGGSGRIEWHQGSTSVIELSAPVTRQSWRLSVGDGFAQLDGLQGGTRKGIDAEALLRDATGFVIPVAALASWVRGAADPDLPPATLRFDADGRLARVQQAGWTIEYADWQPQPGLAIELPHRLNAVQGDARVRLVIDAWQEGAAAP